MNNISLPYLERLDLSERVSSRDFHISTFVSNKCQPPWLSSFPAFEGGSFLFMADQGLLRYSRAKGINLNQLAILHGAPSTFDNDRTHQSWLPKGIV